MNRDQIIENTNKTIIDRAIDIISPAKSFNQEKENCSVGTINQFRIKKILIFSMLIQTKKKNSKSKSIKLSLDPK